VPVRFVGTEIALHVGKKRNSLIRNLQVKTVGMDTGIIEQLEETFSEKLELVHAHLEAVERLVNQKMQLPGQRLLQGLLDRKKNGYRGSFTALPAE